MIKLIIIACIRYGKSHRTDKMIKAQYYYIKWLGETDHVGI